MYVCEHCGQELRIQTKGVRAGFLVHFWDNQFWGVKCPSPLPTKAKPKISSDKFWS
jgi:hypothetical protein